jgi:hypothetical protein
MVARVVVSLAPRAKEIETWKRDVTKKIVSEMIKA